MDGIVYSSVLINILLTANKVRKLGRRFFNSPWNTVDVANYTFFLIPLYFKFIFYESTQPFITNGSWGANATRGAEVRSRVRQSWDFVTASNG